MNTPQNEYTSTDIREEFSPASPPPKRTALLDTWVLAIVAQALIICLGMGLFLGWYFGFQHGYDARFNGMQNAGEIVRAVASQREQVIAAVRPTVVQINVKGTNGNSNGSGVIIDRRGYIVTNCHVVDHEQSIQVDLYNGQTLPATLIGTAEGDDLAVIKVDPTQANLSVARLGDSSQLRVGEDVMDIGNPLGITQTVTNGIVSALGRNVPTGQDGHILPSTIQTDAAINPGNSGGALVDMQGYLVGIPTLTAIDPQFKTPANGVGFAIPSNRVQFIVPQLIENQRVTHTGRAALDAQVVDLDPVTAQQEQLPTTQGALVVSVIPQQAASRAGLQRGDIIVQVDDKAVMNVLSLSDALIHKDLGNVVNIKVYRGSQSLNLQVTLGELPAK